MPQLFWLAAATATHPTRASTPPPAAEVLPIAFQQRADLVVQLLNHNKQLQAQCMAMVRGLKLLCWYTETVGPSTSSACRQAQFVEGPTVSVYQHNESVSRRQCLAHVMPSPGPASR